MRAGERGARPHASARPGGAARQGASAREPHAPRWAAPAAVALSVLGLGLSVYLTVEYFSAGATLVCPETGVVNCQRVTQSEQASVAGIPVAVLGMIYFIATLAASLPVAWRSRRPLVRRGRVALVTAGVAFVLYLIYVELFVVRAICLWCTAVHVVAVALFAVVALATAVMDPPTGSRR